MNNTNPAGWGAGACPSAGGPKEPVLGLLTIIEPGIPMLATGMPKQNENIVWI